MHKPIVLIVDDEPLVAAEVAAALEDADFTVHSVVDAAGAADALAELGSSLSALVTDVRLGQGPDGWSVATQARIQLANLPVVYMTGDSAAEWTAFGVPRSILIQKPFVGAQVITALTTLMNADSGASG